MKFLITLMITVLSSTVFAGGSGGGGVVMGSFAIGPDKGLEILGGGGGLRPGHEIVFHMGQKNGVVKFAYGQLKDNQWQIQNIQIPVNDLALAPEEISALKDSKVTKDWAFIK